MAVCCALAPVITSKQIPNTHADELLVHAGGPGGFATIAWTCGRQQVLHSFC